jgi:putative zinc finger/helix-turn-helix YgiT family protein
MKCENCNGKTIIKDNQKYHFTECGLDNVYLMNIQVRECEECGARSPRIPRLSDLHNAIGKAIALQQNPLAGKEARFLRKHLGVKAQEWAAYIQYDVATLSRCENEKQEIGRTHDALIRALYFMLLEKKTGAPVPDNLVAVLSVILHHREDSAVCIEPPFSDYTYISPSLLCA